MSRQIPCLLFLGLLGVLAGCDGLAPQANNADPSEASARPAAMDSADMCHSGGVAVIDLDEVARRLGAETEITTQVKDKQTQLNQELEALQASYTRQLDEQRRSLNVQPTEEQETALKELDRSLGTRLQQAQLDAQRELVQHQAALINRLRERVRPVARDVAKNRGLSTVVVKNLDLLFHYPTEADITDEVVEKLMAQGSVSIPKLESTEPIESPYTPPATPPSSDYPPSVYERTAEPPGQAPLRR